MYRESSQLVTGWLGGWSNTWRNVLLTAMSSNGTLSLGTLESEVVHSNSEVVQTDRVKSDGKRLGTA